MPCYKNYGCSSKRYYSYAEDPEWSNKPEDIEWSDPLPEPEYPPEDGPLPPEPEYPPEYPPECPACPPCPGEEIPLTDAERVANLRGCVDGCFTHGKNGFSKVHECVSSCVKKDKETQKRMKKMRKVAKKMIHKYKKSNMHYKGQRKAKKTYGHKARAPVYSYGKPYHYGGHDSTWGGCSHSCKVGPFMSGPSICNGVNGGMNGGVNGGVNGGMNGGMNGGVNAYSSTAGHCKWGYKQHSGAYYHQGPSCHSVGAKSYAALY